MDLILGALQTVGSPFEGFTVRKAAIETTDTKSLWSVLNDLSEKGIIDPSFGAEGLIAKSAEKGEEVLLAAQHQGHYKISFEEGEFVCPNPTAIRRIFYSAFRRLLTSKGFRTGLRASNRGVASPIHDSVEAKQFVLSKSSDNVFLQGFRYALEVRKEGKGLLWIDPRISIFNTFAGKFLTKGQIMGAGLVPELRRWSVLEPRVRLSKAQSIVSYLSTDGQLEVESADGTKASFSRDFVSITEA